ncbi:unnamed protein product [Psylliodes chrysocephalus]|uniref:Zinc finger PHD-type domain-containing protein n=1 Tax=Psylliodes chrysocephalus TaxID=3402493 RepID=A0A9P0CXJ4_9CUCU|nr:unnamed protein product [Psylliodes chrysocephala]
MLVCNLKYNDFVIWSLFIFFTERIFPDLHFWNTNSKIALKFHTEIIMPELLGKYSTRKEGSTKLIFWCKCKSVDDGTPMICCDNNKCQIKWLHFICVGLSNMPNTEWICDFCK